jgi:hypothetical protein
VALPLPPDGPGGLTPDQAMRIYAPLELVREFERIEAAGGGPTFTLEESAWRETRNRMWAFVRDLLLQEQLQLTWLPDDPAAPRHTLARERCGDLRPSPHGGNCYSGELRLDGVLIFPADAVEAASAVSEEPASALSAKPPSPPTAQPASPDIVTRARAEADNKTLSQRQRRAALYFAAWAANGFPQTGSAKEADSRAAKHYPGHPMLTDEPRLRQDAWVIAKQRSTS